MCIYGTGGRGGVGGGRGGRRRRRRREKYETEAELTAETKPTRICSRLARSIGQSIKGKDDESRDSHQL